MRYYEIGGCTVQDEYPIIDYLVLRTPPPSMAQRTLRTALLSRLWLIDSSANHIRKLSMRGDPRLGMFGHG